YGYNFGPGNFGPRKPAGTYTPEKVYSFSAPVNCPDYGCEIHESFYVTNYAYLDYCNLIGKTEGKEFKIEHYATRPLDESSCKLGENSSRQRSCQLKFTIPAS